jgi:hypothetical protein
MSTALDASIGLAPEATYGVGVTVTRFVEGKETFDKKLGIENSEGPRTGRRVNRLNRNVVTRVDVAGDLSFDFMTRGLGILVNAFFGAVTNTTIPASAPAVFQQVHTPSITDPLSSFTIQKGVPPVLGGSVVPITMYGMMADQLDFELKSAGIFNATIGWVGKNADRVPSYAAPSYPADLGPLTNVHASLTLGGTVVTPTATALSSGGTAVTNVRDLSMSFKNNLDGDGYNIGGAGTRTRKNMLGALDITGKMTADFDSNVYLDAFWAQTAIPLVLTLSHTTEIETTLHLKSTLEICLPNIRLKGEIPKTGDSKPVTQSIDFEAFDDGIASSPVYVVYRTLDTTP